MFSLIMFIRLNAAAFIKIFVIQVRCLFEGGVYLREVVSNFRESGDRSKNSTFFLFAPKDRLGESFSKIIFKVPASFYFGKKYESSKSAKTYLICIISIGLSAHFHNAQNI